MRKRAFSRFTVLALLAVAILQACGGEAAAPTATTVPPTAVVEQPTTAPTSPPATSKEPIRVGVVATLTGAFAQLGQDGVDGVKIAFDEIGNQINGRPVQLFIEGTDATASQAVDKVRALVNRDKVQLILGPLSGAEGQAVKDNADEWPNTTIIVAGAAAEDITMRGIKPNVWRTSYTGAQPTFALGDWSFQQGYKKVVTIAEDYAFPYSQVGGFMKTFCAAGGAVVKKFWVPIGTSDYSSIFPQIPKDVDALFVALGGTDAVNFVNQMSEYGQLGKKPILGGTVTVDASQLASVGDKLDGVVSGSIMSGDIDTPEFKQLDAAFEKLRQRPPSLFVENYYRGAKFGILALQATNGNIEDQASFRTALQKVEFNAPASHVSFDAYHNVVTDTFLNQVKKINGEWRNSVIKTYPKVSQFWTFDPEAYQKEPPYDRDHPDCPTSTPSIVVTPTTPTSTNKEPIRIGVVATLTGAFAQLGQDGVDGVKIAFDEIGNQINGRPVQLFIEGTDATASQAVDKVRALVNRDKVQLILGPLSGAEGQAVKDNADEWPNTTIIVAGAAAEDITMRGVKPNVWRTSYTGAQPTFALGDWAFKDAGYKKVATIAEDYAFPYSQVGGFMKTYCADGGKVPKKFWVPIGTSDYSSIFPQIPKDVDALFVALGGTDAVNFVNQMSEYGQLGKKPILGGTVTVDASQLASVGDKLDGVVSGSIMSGDIDTPEFKQLDAAFEKLRQRPPSLFVENYYRGAKFGILALQATNGNIEDQAALRTALQKVEFNAPASHVSFDAFHNVVTDTFLNQVKKINGEWRNSVIKTYPAVSQFWTFDPTAYQAEPPFDRDHPDCP